MSDTCLNVGKSEGSTNFPATHGTLFGLPHGGPHFINDLLVSWEVNIVSASALVCIFQLRAHSSANHLPSLLFVSPRI